MKLTLPTCILVALLAFTTSPAGAEEGTNWLAISFTSPQMQPLLQAMDQPDRAALGFTPIPTNAQIDLETNAAVNNCDTLLHVYGFPFRTIGFRQTRDNCEWLFERELFLGPKWLATGVRPARENLTIEFQKETLPGMPTNRLSIHYDGSEELLLGHELTLAEVRPIVEKWRTAPPEAERSPAIDDGIGSPLAVLAFVVFLCCLTLVLAVLAGITLIAATFLIAFLVLAITAGVISTSVLVGLLRRSVSDAFRALFLLLGALAGIAGGAGATALSNWLLTAHWTSPWRWLLGLSLGLLIGLFAAWLFNQTWSGLVEAFTRRLEKRKRQV